GVGPGWSLEGPASLLRRHGTGPEGSRPRGLRAGFCGRSAGFTRHGRGSSLLIVRLPTRSAAGPAEGHDLLVLGALGDVAAAGVPEHERHVVLRVHLEDVGHPPPAPRAVRVLHVLDPGGPATEFVAETANGNALGQRVGPDAVDRQA